MIFAWVDGDTVYTQSKLGGDKKAKNCTILVYDKEGNQLLEGKTDQKGEFSFKVPKEGDLKIVLKASMGHRAQWNIAAEEISAQTDASWSSRPVRMVEPATEEPTGLSAEVRNSEEMPVPTAVGLSRRDIQDLIDESLDRKLAPVVAMLGESLDRGPTLTDVVGGIGYIFGLVGVALYLVKRRKKE
jgi:nickel transport protein